MKLRAPSPALVIAIVALFVSLSGTAVAAGVVPMAKRALFANNAGKLQGKTARQIAGIPGPASSLEGQTADEIAEIPSPASTASSLVTSGSAPFALVPGEEKDFSAGCPSGSKAVSGGFTSPNAVISADSRPTADGNGWTLYLMNLSASGSASGNVQVICLR
ncbi:MAG: hypothetical protein ACJ75P_11095 [Gaiellaceae bacterium]